LLPAASRWINSALPAADRYGTAAGTETARETMPIMTPAQHSVHIVAASVGFTSLVLLWAAVLWGTTLRVGWGLTRIRHQTLYAIHTTLALVGMTLGLVHSFAQLAVPGGPIRLVDEWLPFVNATDPFGVGLGVIATELLVALMLSALVQRRLGYHRWRLVHLMSYVAFTLLCGHVLISGADTRQTWIRVLVAVGWLATLLMRAATTAPAASVPRRVAERMAARVRGQQVTVNVDPTRCVRFGFCEHEAPEVFQLRSDGRLTYRPSVSGAQVEPVLRAVRVCPARAIVLSREATTMVMSGERTGAEQ
jgi:ferredoxin/DMSO/TMAO reductase YedYZ heme-binding membrane subunit